MAANTTLIDELFDIDAIKRQQKEVMDGVKELQTEMLSMADAMKAASKDLNGKGVTLVDKETTEMANKAVKAMDELAKMQAKALQLEEQLKFAKSEEGKAMQYQLEVLKNLTKEQQTANKIDAEAVVALSKVDAAMKAQIKSIGDAQRANQTLRKAVKDLDITTTEGKDTLAKYNKVIDENDKFIKANSDSLVQQKINIGNYKSAIEGVELGTITAKQATETLYKELVMLSLQTENGTKGTKEQKEAYTELVTAYGQFKDKIADSKNAVKGAADDFAALSATLTLVKGGLTIFQGVQAGMAMFGVSNEKILATMQKLQATQMLLNSINEIANLLRQKEIFLAQLQVATESKNIVVKTAAIAVQKALNLVMSANPALLIAAALATLTLALVACNSETESNVNLTKKQQAAMSDLQKEVDKSAKSFNDLEKAYRELQSHGFSESAVLKKQNEALEAFGFIAAKTSEEAVRLTENMKHLQAYYGKGAKTYEEASEKAKPLIERQQEIDKSLKDMGRQTTANVTKFQKLNKEYKENEAQLMLYNQEMKKNEAHFWAMKKGIDDGISSIEKNRVATEKDKEEQKKLATALKEAVKERRAMADATLEQAKQTEVLLQLSTGTEETRAARLALVDEKYRNLQIKNLQNVLQKEKLSGSERVKIETDILKLRQESAKYYNDLGKGTDFKFDFDLYKVDESIEHFNKIYDGSVKSFEEGEKAKQAAIAKTREDIAKQGEAIEEMKKKLIDQSFESIQTVFDVFSTIAANEMTAIKDEQAEWEETFNKRQEMLDAAIMSDETRAARQKALNAEKAAKEEELRKKEMDAKAKAAKVEKAQAIASVWISAAQAAMSATASAAGAGPGFPALMAIFLALVAATAVAQTALIAAQKVPQYEKGTSGHKGGAAITSEHGQLEVIEDLKGRIMETNQPTLFRNMTKGTRVYPSKEAYFKAKERERIFDDSRLIEAVLSTRAEQHMSLDRRGIISIAQNGVYRQNHINQSVII